MCGVRPWTRWKGTARRVSADDWPSEDDRPETYAGYRTLVRVALHAGRRHVVAGLKATGLDVHFPDGEELHFDLEGRC